MSKNEVSLNLNRWIEELSLGVINGHRVFVVKVLEKAVRWSFGQLYINIGFRIRSEFQNRRKKKWIVKMTTEILEANVYQKVVLEVAAKFIKARTGIVQQSKSHQTNKSLWRNQNPIGLI